MDTLNDVTGVPAETTDQRAHQTAAAPSIAVIVPARDAEATIASCLDALLAAGFGASEITVVDDGSKDRTAAIADARGVRILRNETAGGAASARNRGASEATSDIIVFVDADVSIHADIRRRLIDHMSTSDLAGVIGAYDENPGSTSMIGRYRNLLHTYSHRQAAGEVPTFWTGIGAMRRQAFELAGGFRREWESIEDVELGLRVSAQGGRILLDPGVQGSHHKNWRLASMFWTDLHGRATPWTRLLRSGRMPVGVLATSLDKRLSALAVALCIPALIVALVWPPALVAVLVSLGTFAIANAGLFSFLFRVGGPWLTLAALPLHMVHHLAGLLGFAGVVLAGRRGEPAQPAHSP